jgi:hypothetical protein
MSSDRTLTLETERPLVLPGTVKPVHYTRAGTDLVTNSVQKIPCLEANNTGQQNLTTLSHDEKYRILTVLLTLNSNM